jgi:hypothetical protein
MSRADRAGWAAPLAGIVAYSLWVLLDLPAPRYLPLERTFALDVAAGAITMTWYGKLAIALVAAALAGLAARLVRPGARAHTGWLAVALTVVALAAVGALEASHWIVGR